MIGPVTLSDALAVSGQPELADFAALAKEGFEIVVCNRPEGETADQPVLSEVRRAVEATGMRFVNYPVTAVTFPGDDLANIERLFNGSEGKVLAFCRTGTRCTNLWVVSRAPSERNSAESLALTLGYDLTLANNCVQA